MLEYESVNGTWAAVNDILGHALYVSGVAADGYNGKFWGWDSSGNVWTSDGYSGVEDVYGGFQDFAAGQPTNLVAVETSAYGTCPGPPKGNCLESSSDGTHWASFGGGNYGAAQVTLDSVTQAVYALGSDSGVWVWSGSTWSKFNLTKCGGGGFTPAQIAAKNGIVFGIGSGTGTVYYATLGSCRHEVGAKTGFARSIATDNGWTVAVWATDADGAIWTAE